MISKEVLKEIAPNAKDEIISDLELYFDKYLGQYEVNTKQRIAHFLAQCAHESASFRTLEEYASGSAYEGRRDLGNTQPGDGKRFKGRGIIQLTGRANYRAYGKALGIDLENDPERAKDPEVSVLTALEYWKNRNLNYFADKDDITTITKRINGGLNGFADRQKYLERAKEALDSVDVNGIQSNIVLARRGENSDYVKELQNMLIGKGARIEADGDFGPATEKAVKEFQAWSNLPQTGEIDEDTLKALQA